MSRNYKFRNPEGVYFVSFAVVEWIDVFIRDEYKSLLIECLRFCQKMKGMEIFAWCLMDTHMHLVFRSINGQKPEQLLGDYKRFTSKAVVKAIMENPEESRKEWLLQKFREAGAKSSNVKEFQFWQHNNQPIELWSNKVIIEKIKYVHDNPVKEGMVFYPEEYLYSSARDYAGGIGLIEGVVITSQF